MERDKRAIELEALIKKHQDLYYNGIPQITDDEFDLLWDELKLIDPSNELFEKVGKDESDGFRKVAHIIPMGSQEKAANAQAFLDWAEKQDEKTFIVQYKLDGASLELQYLKGRLFKAVTRGDGRIGDDITKNAVKMKGVLKELKEDSLYPFSGAVRGEVLMPKDVFSLMHKDKANCRNAANGVMKRKDGKGCEDLVVVCYDVGSKYDDLDGMDKDALFRDVRYKDEIEKISWLKKVGFNTATTRICETAEEVIEYREEVANIRSSLPFDIDGLVVKNIKLDLKDLQRARPEKQIAFKFELEKAVSTIIDVEWSEAGATYTPIALIDQVHLAGTTVKRASLANPNIIKNLELKIGSRVLVSKRGEIIPKIEALLENPTGCVEIQIPTVCTTCGAILNNEGTRLYCPNIQCKKVEQHRVEKWVKVLNLQEVGSILLRRLFEEGYVENIKDLYDLSIETLSSIERMGELSSKKVYLSIHEKKEVSLAEFIAGFDIEEVGLTMAEKIVAAGYSSIEDLFAASPSDIEKIEGFAQKMSLSFVQGIKEVKSQMQELLASGYIAIRNSNKENLTLAGLSFCFTGELIHMNRKDAEDMCRKAGGSIKSSVSKGLSFLVTNTPHSGSSKNKKASELGIKIISEDEWLSLFK